jgi:hypothetical protein
VTHVSGPKRGIVLPAVLAVLVLLALLSALALGTAVQEYRVATLAEDAVRARAAAGRGLSEVAAPPDLIALCVGGPGLEQLRVLPSEAGGSAIIRWRALGGGVVRAEVEGRGQHGARHRLLALQVPDSAERVVGLFRCPAATRLVPVPGRWVEGHPEG